MGTLRDQKCVLCKNLSFALICPGYWTVRGSSCSAFTVSSFRLRLLINASKWVTFASTTSSILAVAKDMIADTAVKKVVSQMLHLSYDMATQIHFAVFFGTKHIRYPLSTKYRKRIRTVLRIDNEQRYKPQPPDGPAIKQHRLGIVTTQLIEQNTTLVHTDSSPKYKKAQRPSLSAPGYTSPPFGPRYTDTPSKGLDTRTSIHAVLQGSKLFALTHLKAPSRTCAMTLLATQDLTLK